VKALMSWFRAVQVSEVPLVVALVRDSGGWQIDDVSYLMGSARAMRSVWRTGG
jgi:hypothetical protein